MQFSEAEKEKERCEAEHMKRTHECTELKEKIKAIEQEHPKNIAKSRYETIVFVFPSQVVGDVVCYKTTLHIVQ